MAMAGRRMHGLLDPDAAPGASLFDHHVYAICSDGDIEEGVSGEASSIAGTQELGNITMIYDRNRISIEGDTDIAFTEDVAKRYEAYGWHVQVVDWTNGGTEYREDVPELLDAIGAAREVTDKPSLIVLDTIIAWPAPNAQGTEKAHGSALGDEEVAATKKILGWDPDKTFEVPADVIAHTRTLRDRGSAGAPSGTRSTKWSTANPERAALLHRLKARTLPDGLPALPSFEAGEKGVATRSASGKVINAIAPLMPELWGGSADLGGLQQHHHRVGAVVPPRGPGPEEWKADPYRAGCCTSASASTGWARS